jgi:hypothetical protein
VSSTCGEKFLLDFLLAPLFRGLEIIVELTLPVLYPQSAGFPFGLASAAYFSGLKLKLRFFLRLFAAGASVSELLAN